MYLFRVFHAIFHTLRISKQNVYEAAFDVGNYDDLEDSWTYEPI